MPPSAVMPPTNLAANCLLRSVAKAIRWPPPVSVERPRLVLKKTIWNWWTLFERFQAFDELLLGGGERCAFHAARAIEHVDELRADALHAEHADAGLAAVRWP